MSTIPSDEYTNRVARARALMREHGMDGLIVTDPVHYGYFTAHKVPGWMKSRPAILVLPLEGEPALITWSGPEMFSRLYHMPFPSWVEDRRIYPEVPFTTAPRVDWGIADIVRERGLAGGQLGIELGRETWLGISLVDYELLREQLPQARFVDSGPVLWGCRLIKSEWEIDCMREACAIGGRAWQRVFEALRPGISVPEVQRQVLAFYAEEGADLSSEPPMVFGATGAGRTFQKGDILYIDGGCSFAGYKMDITRRAVFGKPSARQLAEHDGMWNLLNEIIERMVPGMPVRELFEFSQTRLAARPQWRNYSDHPAKRIGHGIGLENEPPSISGTDMTVLAENMVLTPEPKIESEDGLVNPEEQVVVRAAGPEIMSDIPHWRLFEVH
ncbi:M24 family metallopeptidase [Nitratireductor sp. CAU 1489]|uniref:M24 family metallopeptidase n=1 Tax=Nitratireductor arenosus TaxID=2682096 RepID=A0A844QFU3_9HYPH|nr:Xaa-Pro peptidase family protein [Nitratireductor arenosus]MVA96948.1 M24 family metallopeptidase [Nitratireductor arenosus]